MRSDVWFVGLCALVLAILLAGCIEPPPPAPSAPTTPASVTDLVLASPAFEDNATIPRKHTCDGEGASPPLGIAGAPDGTQAFALLVIDPDVPLPQLATREFVHWLAWNVPAPAGGASIAEGEVPNGTLEGKNGGGRDGWAGPCPPHGSPAHRYVFTLHALDAPLDLQAGATRDELEAKLSGRILATTTLTGLYERALV